MNMGVGPATLRRLLNKFGLFSVALLITLILVGYLVVILPTSDLDLNFTRRVTSHKAERQMSADHSLNKTAAEPANRSNLSRRQGGKHNPSVAGTWNKFNKTVIQEELARRAERVRNVCQKYGLTRTKKPGLKTASIKHPPTPHYSVFYIDMKHGLSFCPLFKAASTSWMYNFCLLGGLSEEYLATTREQLNKVARRAYPSLEWPEAEEALNKTLKFLIVRHPFERLLSAYRDKLENVSVGLEHGVKHYYQKYGQKIVKKYRKKENNTQAENIKSDDKIKIKYVDEKNVHQVLNPPPVGIEPTFEEFVKYLIDLDVVHYSDDHWMPYYLHCTPCLLEYDVIAKFETLDRDQQFIISAAHLEDKIKSRWSHKTRGVETSAVTGKYFSQISQENLWKLYEKYHLDFELFDYSPDKYLALAQL